MDYYYSKQLNSEAWEIARNNQCARETDNFTQKMAFLEKVFSSLDGTVRKLKTYVHTGFQIFKNGSRLQEFTWEHQGAKALIWGFIGRHLSCGINPDDEVVETFGVFVEQMLTRLFEDINKQPKTLIPLDDWVRSKKGWTLAKKMKYLTTIREQVLGKRELTGAYLGTIKAHEEDFGNSFVVENGFLQGYSSRHRFYVNPSQNWCGFLTYIQAYIFRDLKCCKEFSHGQNCHQLKKTIGKAIQRIGSLAELMSLSLDGSKFDSTQHWKIIERVDFVFWKKYRPRLLEYLILMKQEWNWKFDPETFVDLIISAACQEKAQVFLELPGIEESCISRKEEQLFTKHFPIKAAGRKKTKKFFSGLVLFELLGTTYSGNPVRTTLGNTLRSIMYCYWYAFNAGLFKPEEWKRSKTSNFWCIAAGDDVICWMKREHLSTLNSQISLFTSSNKDEVGNYGLGQIIVDKNFGSWWDIDFCSKWFYNTDSGTLSDWIVSRNYRKTFATKMIYKGENKATLLNPVLHATAIFDGIVSESKSYLVQRLCKYRINYLIKQEGEVDSKLQEQINYLYAHDKDRIYKKEFFPENEELKTVENFEYEKWVLSKIGISL